MIYNILILVLILGYFIGFVVTFFKILPDMYFVSKGVDSRLDALFAVFIALYFSLFWVFGVIGIYLLNPLCERVILFVNNLSNEE